MGHVKLEMLIRPARRTVWMVCCAGLEIWEKVNAGEIGLGVLGRRLKFKARRLAEMPSRLCGTDNKRDPRTKQEYSNVKLCSRKVKGV